MWILVSMITLGYKLSINSIVSYYDADVLRFYDELMKNQENQFKDIFVENLNVSKGNNKNLLIMRNALLEEFVNYMIAGDKSDETLIIKEVYDFDKSIAFLRVLGEEDEKIEKVYNYNLLELRSEGEIKSEVGHYKFLLTKVSPTKIRIDYIE